MAKTKAGQKVAAYGKASRDLEKTAAKSKDETPAYLAANNAKGKAYDALPPGTRTYANLRHG